ncbi:YIP1 family protein [Chitiniphilus eburneus]|nr:YIP1 family protein [Chitiniphilus eburneus]
MKLADYSQMFVSYHEGWDQLVAAHPDRKAVFYKLVLPLSMIPAFMILYAGTMYGSYYAPLLSEGGWLLLAGVFLAAELGTVTLMGWVIHQLALRQAVDNSYDGGYLLAAVAAVPMWLSSLTLFVPNLTFNIVCAVLGLLAACALVYHGVPTMAGHERRDDVRDMTYLVMWIGAGSWAILSILILLPMLGR